MRRDGRNILSQLFVGWLVSFVSLHAVFPLVYGNLNKPMGNLEDFFYMTIFLTIFHKALGPRIYTSTYIIEFETLRTTQGFKLQTNSMVV